MSKTKLMAAGVQSEEDLRLIHSKGEAIEVVKVFKYLGNILRHLEALKRV